MTEKEGCPELSILSAFLDHELDNEETGNVTAHMRSCSSCATRVNIIENGELLLLANFEKSMSLEGNSRSEDCISALMMASYLHEALSADEKERVEDHLGHCDLCLREVTFLIKSEQRMGQSTGKPVPETLRKTVEALWSKGKARKTAVLRIAVSLAREGIEIVRNSLFPPTATCQDVFATAGTYRATPLASMPSAVLVKNSLPEAELSVAVEWESEHTARLRIKIEDKKSNPLGGQRVFLRRREVLLHSERTGTDGGVTFAHLEPETYQLGVAVLEKELYVDLEINKR